MIACREGEDQGYFNKAACRISYLANRWWFQFPLAGHGGEGRKWCYWLVRWILLHPRAPHAVAWCAAVIYGQEGGRCSTSTLEAFSIQRQCSATRCIQVVRPRLGLVCCRWWLLVGRESPSAWCSDGLGASAWRSPARCGGGTLGSDCFLSFYSRVFYVKAKALSSNCRSFRARDENGLFVIYTCHVVLY